MIRGMGREPNMCGLVRDRVRKASAAAGAFVVVCAGAHPAVGATGLAYLEMGAGARALAMGNAVVSSVEGPAATYWNPAGISFGEGTRAEIMHTESFQSVRSEFAALTHRFGRHGVGAAFHGTWTDNLRGYDETGEFQGHFGYSGIAVSGSYALAVSDRISAGLGVELLREQIDVESTGGAALNAGVQLREVLPRTDFGAALLHVGGSMQYLDEEFDLPMTVQAGLTHTLPISALNGAFRVAAEVRSVRDDDTQVLVGTEYAYQDLTRLQVGYQSAHDTQDISFGVGMGKDGIRGQYAFAPFGENLGDQHRFSVEFGW